MTVKNEEIYLPWQFGSPCFSGMYPLVSSSSSGCPKLYCSSFSSGFKVTPSRAHLSRTFWLLYETGLVRTCVNSLLIYCPFACVPFSPTYSSRCRSDRSECPSDTAETPSGTRWSRASWPHSGQSCFCTASPTKSCASAWRSRRSLSWESTDLAATDFRRTRAAAWRSRRPPRRCRRVAWAAAPSTSGAWTCPRYWRAAFGNVRALVAWSSRDRLPLYSPKVHVLHIDRIDVDHEDAEFHIDRWAIARRRTNLCACTRAHPNNWSLAYASPSFIYSLISSRCKVVNQVWTNYETKSPVVEQTKRKWGDVPESGVLISIFQMCANCACVCGCRYYAVESARKTVWHIRSLVDIFDMRDQNFVFLKLWFYTSDNRCCK